jgi:hypothetical protein
VIQPVTFTPNLARNKESRKTIDTGNQRRKQYETKTCCIANRLMPPTVVQVKQSSLPGIVRLRIVADNRLLTRVWNNPHLELPSRVCEVAIEGLSFSNMLVMAKHANCRHNTAIIVQHEKGLNLLPQMLKTVDHH